MGVAVAGYYLLPVSPAECIFLSERERYIATQRIRRENNEDAAAESENARAKHVRRAIFNISNVLCALGFFMINIAVQSFAMFLVSQAFRCLYKNVHLLIYLSYNLK